MRSRPHWLVLLFVAAAPLSCAQLYTPPSSAAQVQGPPQTITGTVVNAVSGEPIRHALVQLLGPRMRTVLTGPDGRFQLEDVPPGPLNFIVNKPGFFDARVIPGHRQDATYSFGSGNTDVALKLFPAAKISGRLTDQDDEPVEQTTVQVLSESITNGRKEWAVRGGASTDDDGSYRSDDLPPGRYVVFAWGQAQDGSGIASEVIGPTFYPEGQDPALAQVIDLQSGQDFRADFHLRAQAGHSIAGTIGGYPTALGLAYTFSTAGLSNNWPTIGVDQSQGRFAGRGIPNGNWILTVHANDSQGRSYDARQEITVNGTDIQNIQILLHPAASIPVTVNHSAKGAVAGNPGVSAVLTSDGPAGNFRQYGLMSRDQRSPPAFENVSEGRYTLNVQGFGGECVDSAWYGNVDLLRDYLVMGPDGVSQPIVINMRGDCATLTPKIDGADNQTSASVIVVPSGWFAEPRVLQFNTQQSGAGAVFHGQSLMLTPGTYQVFAFTNIEGLEYANPEAMRDYPSQSVTLDPNQKLEITVKPAERKAN